MAAHAPTALDDRLARVRQVGDARGGLSAGVFYSIGGADRDGLAAVDARTGGVLPSRADVEDSGELTDPMASAIAVVGDRLTSGGPSMSWQAGHATTSARWI